MQKFISGVLGAALSVRQVVSMDEPLALCVRAMRTGCAGVPSLLSLNGGDLPCQPVRRPFKSSVARGLFRPHRGVALLLVHLFASVHLRFSFFSHLVSFLSHLVGFQYVLFCTCSILFKGICQTPQAIVTFDIWRTGFRGRSAGFDRRTQNTPKCACWSSASYRVWLITLLHATIAACPEHSHQTLGVTFTAQDAPTCNACSVLDLIFMPSQTNEKVGPSCYHRMKKALAHRFPRAWRPWTKFPPH